MKKLFAVGVLIVVVIAGMERIGPLAGISAPAGQADDTIAAAYREQQSGVPVTGDGVVVKVLPDDNDGSRHQRFLLKLPSGQTILIAHNIDLAARISSLGKGDRIEFRGVYEWNPQGGVVHWTHPDPGGRHEAGWVRRR